MRFVEAARAIDPIVELAEKYGYKRRLPQIYYIIGATSLYIEEDTRRAAKYLENAIKIGEEVENLNAVILSNHYLGHAFLDDCEFEKGYQYINKALEILKMVNIPWAIAMHESCIAANIYFLEGKIDKAYKTSCEGLRLAEDSGDILSKSETYLWHGFCSFGRGLFDEAVEYFSKGIKVSKIAKLYPFEAMCLHHLGIVFHRKGEYQKAIECINNSFFIKDMYSAFGSNYNYGKLSLANAKVMNNEKEINVKALCKLPSKNRLKRLEGGIKRTLGEILMNLNENYTSQAEKWITEAIEANRRNGMKFELGLATISYAELFKRKGDQSKATEKFETAIEIFEECGADGWVEKYEKAMAEL
jgi:tetratricopeptide (TPR) repeat protein